MSRIWASPRNALLLRLIGTASFASINGHLSVGKRDILGSYWAKTNAYLCICNHSGACSLPWQGFKGTDQPQKEELILEEKERTNTEDLCKYLLQKFVVYLDYIRSLDSGERSKYAH